MTLMQEETINASVRLDLKDHIAKVKSYNPVIISAS